MTYLSITICELHVTEKESDVSTPRTETGDSQNNGVHFVRNTSQIHISFLHFFHHSPR